MKPLVVFLSTLESTLKVVAGCHAQARQRQGRQRMPMALGCSPARWPPAPVLPLCCWTPRSPPSHCARARAWHALGHTLALLARPRMRRMPRPLLTLCKPWLAALMRTLVLVQTLFPAPARMALGRRRRRRGARRRRRVRAGVGLRVAWRVQSACTPRRAWHGWSVSVRMLVSLSKDMPMLQCLGIWVY